MNQLGQIFTISKYTIKEIIQSRILINIMLLALGLVTVTYVAYSLSYGDPARVALNFGLGSLSISSVAVALFFGMNLISTEMKNRTVYMIISRPVERSSFLLGRLGGLAAVLILNIAILGLVTMIVYLMMGGEWRALIGWSLLFIVLESVLVMLVISLLSLVTAATPAVLYTIALYVVGNAVNETQLITFVQNNPFLSNMIEMYHFVLPAFYKFNIKDLVLYQQHLDFSYLVGTFLYGGLYSTAIILLMIQIFNHKDLN